MFCPGVHQSTLRRAFFVDAALLLPSMTSHQLGNDRPPSRKWPLLFHEVTMKSWLTLRVCRVTPKKLQYTKIIRHHHQKISLLIYSAYEIDRRSITTCSITLRYIRVSFSHTKTVAWIVRLHISSKKLYIILQGPSWGLYQLRGVLIAHKTYHRFCTSITMRCYPKLGAHSHSRDLQTPTYLDKEVGRLILNELW